MKVFVIALLAGLSAAYPMGPHADPSGHSQGDIFQYEQNYVPPGPLVTCDYGTDKIKVGDKVDLLCDDGRTNYKVECVGQNQWNIHDEPCKKASAVAHEPVPPKVHGYVPKPATPVYVPKPVHTARHVVKPMNVVKPMRPHRPGYVQKPNGPVYVHVPSTGRVVKPVHKIRHVVKPMRPHGPGYVHKPDGPVYGHAPAPLSGHEVKPIHTTGHVVKPMHPHGPGYVHKPYPHPHQEHGTYTSKPQQQYRPHMGPQQGRPGMKPKFNLFRFIMMKKLLGGAGGGSMGGISDIFKYQHLLGGMKGGAQNSGGGIKSIFSMMTNPLFQLLGDKNPLSGIFGGGDSNSGDNYGDMYNDPSDTGSDPTYDANGYS